MPARPGLLRPADGGTIFLDARVLPATNRVPEDPPRRRLFRDDTFCCLSAITIEMGPVVTAARNRQDYAASVAELSKMNRMPEQMQHDVSWHASEKRLVCSLFSGNGRENPECTAYGIVIALDSYEAARRFATAPIDSRPDGPA